MNPHAANCAKRRQGWEYTCTCYLNASKPLAPWKIELLRGEKPNPAAKIHDRIAELGKQRDAGLKMIGSLTVDGKNTAAAVAGVKVIDAQITELRNVLGWL